MRGVATQMGAKPILATLMLSRREPDSLPSSARTIPAHVKNAVVRADTDVH
jgi:hypothetical protein